MPAAIEKGQVPNRSADIDANEARKKEKVNGKNSDGRSCWFVGGETNKGSIPKVGERQKDIANEHPVNNANLLRATDPNGVPPIFSNVSPTDTASKETGLHLPHGRLDRNPLALSETGWDIKVSPRRAVATGAGKVATETPAQSAFKEELCKKLNTVNKTAQRVGWDLFGVTTGGSIIGLLLLGASILVPGLLPAVIAGAILYGCLLGVPIAFTLGVAVISGGFGDMVNEPGRWGRSIKWFGLKRGIIPPSWTSEYRLLKTDFKSLADELGGEHAEGKKRVEHATIMLAQWLSSINWNEEIAKKLLAESKKKKEKLEPDNRIPRTRPSIISVAEDLQHPIPSGQSVGTEPGIQRSEDPVNALRNENGSVAPAGNESSVTANSQSIPSGQPSVVHTPPNDGSASSSQFQASISVAPAPVAPAPVAPPPGKRSVSDPTGAAPINEVPTNAIPTTPLQRPASAPTSVRLPQEVQEKCRERDERLAQGKPRGEPKGEPKEKAKKEAEPSQEVLVFGGAMAKNKVIIDDRASKFELEDAGRMGSGDSFEDPAPTSENTSGDSTGASVPSKSVIHPSSDSSVDENKQSSPSGKPSVVSTPPNDRPASGSQSQASVAPPTDSVQETQSQPKLSETLVKELARRRIAFHSDDEESDSDNESSS